MSCDDWVIIHDYFWKKQVTRKRDHDRTVVLRELEILYSQHIGNFKDINTLVFSLHDLLLYQLEELLALHNSCLDF